MELHHGRPTDHAQRLPKEIRTYDFLDSLGVSYARVDHAPAMTMEDCSKIDEILQAPTCKNLFLCNRQATAFYILLMPGDKPFKTKDLSARINSSRLSFASPQHMEEILDITPGSMSVLGLMNDTEHRVTLLIDRDILENEFFGCHPCINTTTLRLTVSDLTKIILPAMGHTATVVELPRE